MNDKNRSAFPLHPEIDADSHSGMTLLDYFAAKAMQAMNTNPAFDETGYVDIAFEAYKQANAMIDARKYQ